MHHPLQQTSGWFPATSVRAPGWEVLGRVGTDANKQKDEVVEDLSRLSLHFLYSQFSARLLSTSKGVDGDGGGVRVSNPLPSRLLPWELGINWLQEGRIPRAEEAADLWETSRGLSRPRRSQAQLLPREK